MQLGGGLLMATVGCTQALGLGDYSFPGAGAGAAGASPDGASADGRWPPKIERGPWFGVGSAGAGGVSPGLFDMRPETPVVPDAPPISSGDPDAGTSPLGSDAGDASPPDADPLACALDQRCVPPVPAGWNGPVVLALGTSACPPTYPTFFGNLNAGLLAGAESCSCSCDIRTRSCFWTPLSEPPPATCAFPNSPFTCFGVAAEHTCTTEPIGGIGPSSWQYTKLACGNPVATGACGGGSCYPSASELGPPCITTSGEVSCPAEFPHGDTYYRAFSDSRACAGTCGCQVVDAFCSLDVVLCRNFGESQELASIPSGGELCLADGDGVDIRPDQAGPSGGNCLAAGAVVSGSVTPTDAVTVCCLE